MRRVRGCVVFGGGGGCTEGWVVVGVGNLRKDIFGGSMGWIGKGLNLC